MRFRNAPAQIRGSIAPVVSPFTADGAPDLDGLRALIRWQLESGSHGISLGGSTGEPSAQTTFGTRDQRSGRPPKKSTTGCPSSPGLGRPSSTRRWS